MLQILVVFLGEVFAILSHFHNQGKIFVQLRRLKFSSSFSKKNSSAKTGQNKRWSNHA